MAVFRRGRLNASPRTCADLIRFADFERTAEGLAARVAGKPSREFPIRRRRVRGRLRRPVEPPAAGAPKYDRNERLPPGEDVECVIFRKRRGTAETLAVRAPSAPSGQLPRDCSNPNGFDGFTLTGD